MPTKTVLVSPPLSCTEGRTRGTTHGSFLVVLLSATVVLGLLRLKGERLPRVGLLQKETNQAVGRIRTGAVVGPSSTSPPVAGRPTTSVAPPSTSSAVPPLDAVTEVNEERGCSCRSLPSPASAFSSGSAANPNRTSCCLRAALVTHKFGTVLNGKFFDPYPSIAQHPFRENFIPDDPNQDYRHVALVRNLYSALVSGYLYHKSGRECWLDNLGNHVPWNSTSPYAALGRTNFDWTKAAVRLRIFPSQGPTPPRNNRTLCQYLADESIHDGMRVYMAVARSIYYSGILPYLDKAKQRIQSNHPNGSHGQGNNKTMFVCLEEASNPQQEQAVFHRLVDWLFPSGEHNLTLPEIVSDAAGHGTPHDAPIERRAMMDLAKQYDQDYYGHIFRQMNAHFNCRETI